MDFARHGMCARKTSGHSNKADNLRPRLIKFIGLQYAAARLIAQITLSTKSIYITGTLKLTSHCNGYCDD